MTPEMYNETLVFGLQMAGVGLSVVFVALVTITVIVSNFDRLDQWLHRAEPEAKAPVADKVVQEAPIPETGTDGLTPEIIAAISAAVNEAVSKKVRITRIRYRQRPSTAWHVQGRATIMAQHHE